MNNLFFLCGPHGSGKTTLGDEIKKENSSVLIPELYSRSIKFHTEPCFRQALKVGERAIENFEYSIIARENPGKMIIANRCIYDNLAYHWVYFKRGWISKKEFGYLNSHTKYFFQNELQEPYAIVVNPGFDVCKRHLEKRWAEKEKKYKEDDLEYLALACEAYKRFQNNEKVLYFDREIDLEKRAEIKKSSEWIQTISSSLLRKEQEIKNLKNSDCIDNKENYKPDYLVVSG